MQEEITNAESGATIFLANDYVADSEDTALVIPSGKTITLQLNGHVIDRNLVEAAEGGNVINNNGILTIDGSGTIRGGFNSGSGGAFVNYGRMSIGENGYVTISRNNAAGNGGGVWNGMFTDFEAHGSANYNGKLTVCNGSIVENTAEGMALNSARDL